MRYISNAKTRWLVNIFSKVRLLVHEGLQCGFRQEAVCIDPDKAIFASLGRVDKSLIVTPDVERAFVFS
jgi:hypothetical protein